MRSLWKDIATALFMGLVLPGLMLNGIVMVMEPETTAQETAPPVMSGWTAMVRTGDAVTEMDLDSYITGVVLAEMPASFEEEALKAQSVAARTYTRKAAATGGKHGDGSVCTDSACCQGYITEEDYLQKGGTGESVDKIRSAVFSTTGCVLTYEGELIEAAYFSCSGGSTEDAAAVWGTDFPYLQSVDSPGEEGDAVYAQTLEFTPEEFAAALGRDLRGNPEHWFTITTYTEGGGVAAMTICGERYAGTQLRTLLGLRSTAFTVAATQEKIAVTTRGYGHRVGMSQYGADAMAASGCTYREILAHYYPGTVLTKIDETAPP